MNLEDAFEQGTYNLINTPLLLYPFPHFFAETIFPVSFYKNVIAQFPSEKHMKSLKELGRGTYEKRFIFPLTSKSVEELDETQRMFWDNISKLFFSQKFYQAVVQKFGAFFDKEKLQQAGLKRIVPRIDLVEDQEEYTLTPHTDYLFDLATFLFYLPEDNDHLEWGTSLYVPKKEVQNLESNKHYEREKFIEIKKFPFLPNSALAFARTDNSFHGVEPIKKKEGKVKRRLLIYTVQGLKQ